MASTFNYHPEHFASSQDKLREGLGWSRIALFSYSSSFLEKTQDDILVAMTALEPARGQTIEGPWALGMERENETDKYSDSGRRGKPAQVCGLRAECFEVTETTDGEETARGVEEYSPTGYFWTL